MKRIIVLLTVCFLSSVYFACEKELNITDNNNPTDLTKAIEYSLAYKNDSVSILNDSTVIFSSLIYSGGFDAKYFIEYGKSQDSLVRFTQVKNIAGDTSFLFMIDTISGLVSNINYLWRIHVYSSIDTIVSLPKTFIIDKEIILPSIINDSVGSILGTSAVYCAEINPKGLTATYYFEYRTFNGLEYKTVEKVVGSDSTRVVVRDTVFNLSPGTTYKYRLVVSNVNGISTGIEKSFITLNVILPQATLWQAKDITTNSALLEAWVKTREKNVRCYFEYGETQSYGMKSNEVFINASKYDMIAIAIVYHLRYGTQYHWRLHCIVDSGEVWSDDGVFSTKNILNPIEFVYPLTVGTTLAYDYYFYSGMPGAPPSEVTNGIRIWDIKSKHISGDSTIYNVFCTAKDTILKRDTSYYSEEIPFTIVFTKDYIYVGFDKIVRSAASIPLPRYVESGNTAIGLGNASYINGIGLQNYFYAVGSNYRTIEKLTLR